MFKLRPFQKKALAALGSDLQSSSHVLCIAPTGAGKSLIYEKAASRAGRRTLLITPLVALARQQQIKLQSTTEVTLFSGVRSQEKAYPKQNELRSQIWIASPETLHGKNFLTHLKEFRPNLLVVDECHCLFEWGDSFRPAFWKIPRLLQDSDLNIPKSIWLTATLRPVDQCRISQITPTPLKVVGEFGMPKCLKIFKCRLSPLEKVTKLLKLIGQSPQSVLVYCTQREQTRKLHNLIESQEPSSAYYHAGLSAEERRAIEGKLRNDQLKVIVSTSAFGMGMDYPQLRNAILWEPPSTILSLVQLIGRVGRSGLPSEAHLFWHPKDFESLEWTTQFQLPRIEQLIEVFEFYRKSSCPRQWLCDYFNKESFKTPYSQ